MRMIQLIYFSKARIFVNDVFDILKKSDEKNATLNLSGLLVFHNNYFLQVLEGNQTNVSRVLFKIAKDPRHEDVEIIQCKEIDKRDFGEWSMNLVRDSELNTDIISKYCSTSSFNPTELTGSSSLKFLQELSYNIPK